MIRVILRIPPIRNILEYRTIRQTSYTQFAEELEKSSLICKHLAVGKKSHQMPCVSLKYMSHAHSDIELAPGDNEMPNTLAKITPSLYMMY